VIRVFLCTPFKRGTVRLMTRRGSRAAEDKVAEDLRARGWTCYPPAAAPGILLGTANHLVAVPRHIEVQLGEDDWTGRATVRRSSPVVGMRFVPSLRLRLVTQQHHGYCKLHSVRWDPDDVKIAYLELTGEGRMMEHGA
jgi:hypothetical protein